jgi:hypothetical protein
MVPVAVVYKVTGCGNRAMHFIAGKVMREKSLHNNMFAFYLQDANDFRAHIDDTPKEIRPWVRVTNDIAQRRYDDPTMPRFSKLEIDHVVFMQASWPLSDTLIAN